MKKTSPPTATLDIGAAVRAEAARIYSKASDERDEVIDARRKVLKENRASAAAIPAQAEIEAEVRAFLNGHANELMPPSAIAARTDDTALAKRQIVLETVMRLSTSKLAQLAAEDDARWAINHGPKIDEIEIEIIKHAQAIEALHAKRQALVESNPSGAALLRGGPHFEGDSWLARDRADLVLREALAARSAR
jgi:hypothetical protein